MLVFISPLATWEMTKLIVEAVLLCMSSKCGDTARILNSWRKQDFVTLSPKSSGSYQTAIPQWQFRDKREGFHLHRGHWRQKSLVACLLHYVKTLIIHLETQYCLKKHVKYKNEQKSVSLLIRKKKNQKTYPDFRTVPPTITLTSLFELVDSLHSYVKRFQCTNQHGHFSFSK